MQLRGALRLLLGSWQNRLPERGEHRQKEAPRVSRADEVVLEVALSAAGLGS